MSMDPSADHTTTISSGTLNTAGLVATTPQTAVTVTGVSTTPAQAAAAVQDVTGGLEQDLVSDASRNFGPYRYFLLGVLAFLVVYALVLYAVILLGYVLDGNERAHGILTSLGDHAAVIALPFAGYVAGWLTPTPKVAKTSGKGTT